MAYRCTFLEQHVGVLALWHDLPPLQEVGQRRLHSQQPLYPLYLPLDAAGLVQLDYTVTDALHVLSPRECI